VVGVWRWWSDDRRSLKLGSVLADGSCQGRGLGQGGSMEGGCLTSVCTRRPAPPPRTWDQAGDAASGGVAPGSVTRAAVRFAGSARAAAWRG